jgi:AraC-like DNA-binding protein
MDPLSDVLRAVRLNGAFFYLVEAAEPWSVAASAACELVPRVLPDVEHLISYHILLEGTGWGGLDGKPQVQLHERPHHPWTLAELARTIASSRTVLAERSTQLVGIPPMTYLARWRLQLAAAQLLHSSSKVAAIGTNVGYDSEAAFSRAFKRETGMSPAAWRRARVQAR